MIRKNVLLSSVFILICLFFLQACPSQTPAPSDLLPVGTLVSYDGCKSFDSGSSAAGFFSPPGQDQECLEYTYTANVLRIKHINAAFNCCLDAIVGNVSIDGSIIRIESEGILANGMGCFCICLYDVEYEILNLPPSAYTIVAPTFSHSLEIDLRKVTSDRYCESRDTYPWK